MPTFTPPTIEEGMEVSHGLWRYFKLRKGITVVVSGDTVTEIRFPYAGDLPLYDYVYLGGYDHDITDDEAATLIDAGYASYIT